MNIILNNYNYLKQASEHLFSQFSQLSELSEGDTSAPRINIDIGLCGGVHNSSSQTKQFSNATKYDAISRLVLYFFYKKT